MSGGYEHSPFSDEARQDVELREVSRMVPVRGPLNDHMRRDIHDALREFMQKNGLSQADVAKGIGTSAAYLSNLINGGGPLSDEQRDLLWRDANNWLDREARARAGRRDRRMVETRVARGMTRIASRLTERPDIAYVEAPPGVGKTFCAEVIAERLNAAYICVDPDCAAPSRFLRELYNAISRKRKAGRVELAEIVDKLRMPERVATCNLVIIDQAHELVTKPRSLRMLMALHDRARCSILLVGTSDLSRAFELDNDALFGQMYSRVGYELSFRDSVSRDGVRPPPNGGEWLFTREDIAALFDSDKIKLHRDSIDMLLRLANSGGKGLRVVMRVLYQAEIAARKRGANEITVQFVQAAMIACREKPRQTSASDEQRDERRAIA